MCILEGQVAFLDGDNNETIINQGDTFFVRNAIPVSWKQVGFCRKFFMMYLVPNAPTPKINSIEGGINILREEDLGPKLKVAEEHSPLENEVENPIQKKARCFTNDTGNMSAGMWESHAFESPMSAGSDHEFIQMLEGKVSNTEADGEIHEFTAGDIIFIPEGTLCSWKVDDLIRAFYCTLTPPIEN